jgi:hypothetical protein
LCTLWPMTQEQLSPNIHICRRKHSPCPNKHSANIHISQFYRHTLLRRCSRHIFTLSRCRHSVQRDQLTPTVDSRVVSLCGGELMYHRMVLVESPKFGQVPKVKKKHKQPLNGLLAPHMHTSHASKAAFGCQARQARHVCATTNIGRAADVHDQGGAVFTRCCGSCQCNSRICI